MKTTRHISHGIRDTWAIAANLIRSLRSQEDGRHATIALHGELGVGKTCFAQGIAREMGIFLPITSPTYTLVNEYHSAPPLYHIDLYRLHSADDAQAMGFEDYIDGPGVTVVEWPDRAADLLPDDTIHVYIRLLTDSEDRCIVIDRPCGSRREQQTPCA